jgi:ribosomal protein L37AE/L43A
VSAALAAAELTGLERERRWLVAMARAVDRTGTLRPVVAPDAELGETAGYRAALAVGAVRAGQGLLARRLLEDESVAAIFRRFNRSLTDSGSRATLMTLRREAQLWPCPRCQGQKILKRGASTIELCPVCLGAHGPKISRGQLVAQLRFESVMLGTLPRTWASQFLMDRGEPLRDLDAADVAPTLGADVSRPRWREGAWVER